jgi:uncharacterized membrane protein SpoIIM required for sporulation
MRIAYQIFALEDSVFLIVSQVKYMELMDQDVIAPKMMNASQINAYLILAQLIVLHNLQELICTMMVVLALKIPIVLLLSANQVFAPLLAEALLQVSQ